MKSCPADSGLLTQGSLFSFYHSVLITVMISRIQAIILGGMSGNCYLLETEDRFVLIDTGSKSKRKKLEQILIGAGCLPGKLDLVLLTHGDFDHSGNCAYLRENYQTKVAMHAADAGMVETGNMFANRQAGNQVMKGLIKLFFRITRFSPDFIIDEQSDLSAYGLHIKILSLPGHSRGSIGFLFDTGEFFCGDLFANWKDKPAPGKIIDNKREFEKSLSTVRDLNITTIYPGHGQPFSRSEVNYF